MAAASKARSSTKTRKTPVRKKKTPAAKAASGKTAKKTASKKTRKAVTKAAAKTARKSVGKTAKTTAMAPAATKVASPATEVPVPGIAVDLSPAPHAGGPIVLEARLGIQNVAELRDQLAQALAAECDIEIDTGTVESVDTAAIQVLLSFANACKSQGRSLKWHGDHGAVKDSLQLAGLGSAMDFDGADAAADADDGLCPVF